MFIDNSLTARRCSAQYIGPPIHAKTANKRNSKPYKRKDKIMGKTIHEMWSEMMENLTTNGGMDFLLLGLNSKCTGRVREDQDSKDSVQFTLDINWDKCTFEHLISLAMRTVRIDAQSKMRTDGIPADGETISISVSKKTVKGVATPEGLVKKFEKMTSDQKSAFLDLMNSALGN